MFKSSKIAMAVATVCGAFSSGSALAIDASLYSNTDEFTGSTLNIRISGASAQDNGILGSALSFCVAGTMTRYTISNNFAFYCTPDIGTNAGQLPSSAFPSPKDKLAIYKYSVGGSYYGVGPVNSNTAATGATLSATGNQLPFLDLTKLAANCTGTNATTTTVTFNTTLGSYTNVVCGNGSTVVTTSATTYMGVSDVEPAFFVTAANRANLTSKAVYALIFGVPVSLNIRNALQTQQGLISGDDSEAQMPSLTSAQIATAYTQAGQTWAGIGVTSGLGDDTIYLARRVNSSGTQKTFEALFARTPNGEGSSRKGCAVGTTAFSLPDSPDQTNSLNNGDAESVCTNGTQAVYSGSGGGNVRNCLINHHGAGRGAIGILTMEDKPGSANWRFVKIDGVAPTQAQVANGRYRHYVESFLNTRTSGTFATNSALSYSTFVSRLTTDLANATIIKAINGANQTFGASGLMALATAQAVLPAPDFTGASSIIPWTKLVGTTTDNCQAPALAN